MKKKYMSATVSGVLAFCLFIPSAFADSRHDEAKKLTEQAMTGQLNSNRLKDVRGDFKAPTPSIMAMQPIALNDGFITPTYGRFTSKFGWRDIGAGPEFHKGIDIANVIGTNVVAAAGGIVTHAQFMNGYGNVVIIKHLIKGQVYATAYAHLSVLNISSGQQVTQGQSVGKMGNTGRSFGSHLHFEIHNGEWNGGRTNAVDPTRFISI